jgi:hypothetical protein
MLEPWSIVQMHYVYRGNPYANINIRSLQHDIFAYAVIFTMTSNSLMITTTVLYD